ncbi:MAG TPA: 2-amino-4-hydroxy-6-hydroxymethyldihydropteridine diphosphokinase [Syntrophales bacterium]|nr:2-amino-4-hydroxy-6-hydroxymethyldihydropteridine diphosphokinase [Syntrophales bacterium]HPQ44391.1 2-amino-4-hydroxy-6-hydroxymethyldihydropteridine diphosphokinase [Syntrophales bacterium]
MDDGVICFLGIGSNMGDAAAQCNAAIENVSDVHGIRVLRRSSLYKTQPVGFEEQDWFVNGVIEIRTMLEPRSLLHAMQEVENKMGRIRNKKWGPRIIDIDILLYDQLVMDEKDLAIPHAEFHTRRFVLVPLNEIAPCAIHPAFGISAHGLLVRLEDNHVVERLSGEGRSLD